VDPGSEGRIDGKEQRAKTNVHRENKNNVKERRGGEKDVAKIFAIRVHQEGGKAVFLIKAQAFSSCLLCDTG
jgi:hypothetical protein